MKNHLLRILVLSVVACRGDDFLRPPPPPASPALRALEIVSGNGQQGTSGSDLGEPFVVRVTGPGGTGVGSVPVRWTVVAGSGAFEVASANSLTASDGVAFMFFRPTSPGLITVRAQVDGLPESPAMFTANVTGYAVVVIRFGPLFDCYGTPSPYDPSIFEGPEGTIPLGSRVEWEYAAWLPASCSARVRTVSVPPGGVPFDSGDQRPGERFGFVPGVAGDWRYEDSINGGTGTLRVR